MVCHLPLWILELINAGLFLGHEFMVLFNLYWTVHLIALGMMMFIDDAWLTARRRKLFYGLRALLVMLRCHNVDSTAREIILDTWFT